MVEPLLAPGSTFSVLVLEDTTALSVKSEPAIADFTPIVPYGLKKRVLAEARS